MKKIVFISAFLLVALSCFAQEEVQMIQFSREYHIPGVPANELYETAKEWYKVQQKEHDFTCARWFSFPDWNSLEKSFQGSVILDEKNLGVSPFLGGGNTLIAFTLLFKGEWGKYTVTTTKIDVYSNPDLGILYGSGTILIPEFYTKRQLKMAPEIIRYMSQVTDEIFSDIENWMREKCPTPDSGVEIIP